MGNRLNEGVCILCQFPLLAGTNKEKQIQGLCEECSKKFIEKVKAMEQNPDLVKKQQKVILPK